MGLVSTEGREQNLNQKYFQVIFKKDKDQELKKKGKCGPSGV